MAKILVVDDDENVGEVCTAVLSMEGHKVTYVEDGDLALKATKKKRYDLAIVDLVMPGIDGYTVVKYLRKKYPDMKIIILSGYASFENAVKGMKAGADDFLTKPVWNMALSECVDSVLGVRVKNKKLTNVSAR